MKKIEAVLVSLCFGFIAVSSGRLLVHIVSNDLRTLGDVIGLMPVIIFIGFLFYLGGGLCWEIVREAFSRQSDLK